MPQSIKVDMTSQNNLLKRGNYPIFVGPGQTQPENA